MCVRGWPAVQAIVLRLGPNGSYWSQFHSSKMCVPRAAFRPYKDSQNLRCKLRRMLSGLNRLGAVRQRRASGPRLEA
jgi:hypothetical protein